MQTELATPSTANKPGAGAWRVALLAALVVGALLASRWFDLGRSIGDLRSFIEDLGAWGPWAFLLLYIVAVVAAVPGSAITVAAGTLFGSVVGLLVVSAGSTLGASLAFLIARYLARGTVERWLADSARFRRLDAMTEQHGALMVAVTRLVPLFPFNLVNYGFGFTRVPFWTYVFWSWLAILPISAVYVVGADAVTAALRDNSVPWGLLAALAALLVLTFGLAHVARRRLADGPGETP